MRVYFLPDGKITRITTGVPFAPDDGELFIDGDFYGVDFSRSFVQDGAVVSMPPRPSPHHVFDYAAKQWVDPRTLDDLKAGKWAEIKRKRDEVEFGGFTWDGSVFDSDQLSQSRIQGAVQLATLAAASGQPFSIDWTLADNTVRTLSASEMIAVGSALAAHVEACHTIGRQLREAINNASSREDLDAVQWPQS